MKNPVENYFLNFENDIKRIKNSFDYLSIIESGCKDHTYFLESAYLEHVPLRFSYKDSYQRYHEFTLVTHNYTSPTNQDYFEYWVRNFSASKLQLVEQTPISKLGFEKRFRFLANQIRYYLGLFEQRLHEDYLIIGNVKIPCELWRLFDELHFNIELNINYEALLLPETTIFPKLRNKNSIVTLTLQSNSIKDSHLLLVFLFNAFDTPDLTHIIFQDGTEPFFELPLYNSDYSKKILSAERIFRTGMQMAHKYKFI